MGTDTYFYFRTLLSILKQNQCWNHHQVDCKDRNLVDFILISYATHVYKVKGICLVVNNCWYNCFYSTLRFQKSKVNLNVRKLNMMYLGSSPNKKTAVFWWHKRLSCQIWHHQQLIKNIHEKYTNPANPFRNFCKQKLRPLP